MPDQTRAHSDSTCPLCSSPDYALYLRRSVKGCDYLIVRCQNCELLYLFNAPTANALNAFYNSSEYFDGDVGGYDQSYFKQRAAIERQSARRLRQIQDLIALAPTDLGHTLLDVGCAAGFFLHVAQARGWRVSGVEISRSMAAHAAQLLGIEIKTSLEDETDAHPFSVVTLWEVVEHLTDPLGTLRQVHQRLKPGGLVALSTPNTGHWHAQRHPAEWSEFKPPAHVVYFTETTLRTLLTRAGFANVIVRRTRMLATSPQTLARLRKVSAWIGDGAERKTPFWFLTSLLYRLVMLIAGTWHHLQKPDDDLYIGLEAFARKPSAPPTVSPRSA